MDEVVGGMGGDSAMMGQCKACAGTGSASSTHAVIPVDRLDGHSVDEILRQAFAWREHIDGLEKDFPQRHIPYSAATDEPVSLRQRCLDTAREYILRDRNAAHGSPESNFDNIARYWNAHLRARYGGVLDLDATDVALMMIGMKAARLSHNPRHEDSWIDTAGYAACGMEVALSQLDKD